MVVAPPPEPAVVEHEPFHADPGRHVGEPGQPVQPVVEVHRLPGVQHDRARGARVVRAGAQEAVQPLAQPVEAGAGPDEVRPRRGVRLPFGEPDLTGGEQLAAADDGEPFGDPFGHVGVVAAPPDVYPPDLAGSEAEPVRTGDQQPGPVVAGAPAPVLPQPGAVGERAALRCAFAGPPPGEVQQFQGIRRYGQERVDPLDGVRAGAGVGQRVPDPQYPFGAQDQLGGQRDPGVDVGGAYPHRAVLERRQRRSQRPYRAGVQRTEIGAPVQHPGQAGAGDVEHQHHAVRPEYHRLW